MMRLLVGRIAHAAVVCSVLLADPVWADSVSPPYTYSRVSHGGKYIFVILSPLPLSNDAAQWNADEAAEIRRLRQTYSKSGLYRNDGSTTPLWTVSWYAYDVRVASDGVHLVREGPWASSGADEAVTFFANGQRVRQYFVKDLVTFPRLMPHSVSHFRWRESAQFDDVNLTYTLSTLHEEQYVFDIRTGAMISSDRPPVRALWSALGLFAALSLLMLGTIIVQRRKRRGTVEGRRAAMVEAADNARVG